MTETPPYRSVVNEPRVVPYIVIRPAPDLPEGFLPDDWNGRWIKPPILDTSVRTTVFGATAIATDRYEQREDGVWAQVYEVQPLGYRESWRCIDGTLCPQPKACRGEQVCLRVEAGDDADPPLSTDSDSASSAQEQT